MNRFVRCFTLISGLLISGTVWSLPGDRELPINVEADRNQGSLSTNQMTYIGNVHITQGALTIVGDQVVIYRSDNNDVERMVATGEETPARVTDQLEEDEPETQLDGLTVIYNAEDGIISAQGQARLTQGRNLVTAHYIRYDINTEDFESDVEAPDGSRGERVRMCLVPEGEDSNGEATDRATSCQTVR